MSSRIDIGAGFGFIVVGMCCPHVVSPLTSQAVRQMNTVIELHDSKIAEIETRQTDVVVVLLSAYLHKSDGRPGFDAGTGWTQDARLVFENASVSGGFPDLPCKVMGGELILDGERYDNLIPLPLVSRASAELRLIFDSMHAVTVVGRGVQLELLGEPQYVEEFRS